MIQYFVTAFTITLLAMSVQADTRAITLANSGKSGYVIVVSPEASPSEKYASEELRKFLKEISGAEFPIVTDTGRSRDKMILVGDGPTLRSLGIGIDFKDLGDEGLAIKTAGPHLVIAGGRLRGTMYGVYTFLDDVLGCRWYTRNVSRIPRKSKIVLQQLNIVQKPDFEYREPYYTAAITGDGDWSARNKVNGHNNQLSPIQGGAVTYGRFCHTFDAMFPVDKYYAEHPEYYSLVNGKRVGGQESGQLCLTNPEVTRIAIETVLGWIKERPNATIFSVSQNDNFTHCQCERCAAVDKEEGSPSGTLLRFVNAVADEVAKKYPDKLIDTFAYLYTEAPPKITKPRPNVIVRLCSIRNCQHHPIESCEHNAKFMKCLQGWSKLTDRLYIWHYTTNFAYYLFPFPDLSAFTADFPLFRQHGVKGMFAEGTSTAGYYPAGGGGGYMDDLKMYVLAKLMWNVHADVKGLTKDFLEGFYGKAAKPIGQYVDLLERDTAEKNIHGDCFSGVESIPLTPESLAVCERLFDEAEKLVAGSPEFLAKVKHARMALEFYKLERDLHENGDIHYDKQRLVDTLAHMDELAKDLQGKGIKELRGGTPFIEYVRRYRQIYTEKGEL